MSKTKTNRDVMIVTSEQVGRGHPDKICDQVSDLILAYILKHDKNAKVAAESAIGKGKLFITGEISTTFKFKSKDLVENIKKLLVSIDADYKDFKIEWNMAEQSPEIQAKVVKDKDSEVGAGDQGLMYGYATNETKNRLPIPYALATKIIVEYEKQFAEKSKHYKFDSKSQVCFDYGNQKIININLSVQHSKEKDLVSLRKELTSFLEKVVKAFEKENGLKNLMAKDSEIIVNNAGTFILGGALADAGLTGRKIIADSYGGFGRHGGGAFSGKDYTKVDRSAAYYARYAARKIIDAKLADICEVQVSYIIGRPHPIAVYVETFDTNKVPMEKIYNFVSKTFDFSVANIIKELKLKEVDYTKTTMYGHFGKKELPWQ